MILYLTFCLILFTLVVQGLTLPWIIRSLGLAKPGEINLEEQEARRVLIREAMVHVDRARARDRSHRHIYDDLADEYQHRLNALPLHRPGRAGLALQDYTARRNQTIAELNVERNTLIRLRDAGEIDDETMRTLQRELDLSESRVHTDSY